MGDGRQREAPGHSHDVFVSHASEDKDAVARPLAQALTARGWTAWLDELEMTVGDSLSGRIDEALARSRFGVVILSPSFFAKRWPQRELSGLAAREVQSGAKVILPVWHSIDREEILRFSPTLADRLGAQTRDGVGAVADQLSAALEKAIGPRASAPLAAGYRAELTPDSARKVFRYVPRDVGQAADRGRTDARIGRNDPCWCGSGRKYKKCHGI